MERVLVLGCPGSGKSYLSKQLAMKTGLPLTHLDNLYWSKDKVSCSTDDLIKKMEPILIKDKWIIDGNYHQTLEQRIARATDVIFLDLPRDVFVKGIKERINVVRDDIPWVESEEDANELIEWTKDYQEKTRPIELEILSKHPEVNVLIIHSRSEMEDFLSKIK